MKKSIRATITRNGNVVRNNLARMQTAANYLREVKDITLYKIYFRYDGKGMRMTGEQFLHYWNTGEKAVEK